MKLIRKIHLYSSMLVGLQVLIWVITGFIFNVMDHQKASGNLYRETAIDNQHINNTNKLIPINVILSDYQNAVHLELIYLLEQPYYLVFEKRALYRHFSHDYQLVDAISGDAVILNEAIITRIALHSYNGPGNIISTSKLLDGGEFLKERNPSWRVDFSDDVNTSVYIDAVSGRLLGHSNDDKRFRDLLFKLHFMDYAGTGSFNNIVIKAFTLLVLCLSITGSYWLIRLIRNRQVI